MSDVREEKPESERISGGRGPAYPAISLERAMELVEKVREANIARSAVSTDVYYRIWGYKGESGANRPLMAGLNHFGLIDYVGRGDSKQVRLSPLCHRIIFDKVPNSPLRAEALRESATAPTIFSRLFNHLGVPVPPQFVVETFLTRDCGYSEQAAEAIYRNYVDTLAYAGLDKPDNMPEAEPSGPSGDTPLYQEAEVGDLIQWESAGVLQLPKPARVRAVQELEGQKWVFIEGSETGIPMEQVLVEQKGSSDGKPPMTPPRLPETPPDARLSPTEREWLRGPLSKETSYRLIVAGELGPKEIGKLIKLLEAQKAILAEDDEGAE